MAMMGLSKSPSFMPVALQRARAPAIFRPCVVVWERYLGIFSSLAMILSIKWAVQNWISLRGR